MTIVVLAADNLREKKSVPLTKWSGIACFKNSCGAQVYTGYSTQVGNHCIAMTG